MRNQRVILRQEAGAALLRREIEGAFRIEPDMAAELDGADEGAIETREHPQQGGLARARRAKEYGDGRALERQPEAGIEYEAGGQAGMADAVQFIGHTFQ